MTEQETPTATMRDRIVGFIDNLVVFSDPQDLSHIRHLKQKLDAMEAELPPLAADLCEALAYFIAHHDLGVEGDPQEQARAVLGRID